MELDQIVSRLAAAIPAIDASTQRVEMNAKTGVAYGLGVPTLTEPHLRDEFIQWWLQTYPADFSPVGACLDEQSYEAIRGTCDMILSSHGGRWPETPEWAIELKRIQLVGDNGKNNDYGLAKVLSPYLKDRSMLHDAERLSTSWMTSRVGILAYGFVYDNETILEAKKRHPGAAEQVRNLSEVCRKNDALSLAYGVGEMLEIADAYFRYRNLIVHRAVAQFADAWRHPCGGKGYVVGWEIQHVDETGGADDLRSAYNPGRLQEVYNKNTRLFDQLAAF